MTAILDFATRSDRVGMRARDLLASIRFGAAGDAEEMARRIYIGRSGAALSSALSVYVTLTVDKVGSVGSALVP